MAKCEICGLELNFMNSVTLILPSEKEENGQRIKVCKSCDARIYNLCLDVKNSEIFQQRKESLLGAIRDDTAADVKNGIIHLIQVQELEFKERLKERLKEEEQKRIEEEQKRILEEQKRIEKEEQAQQRKAERERAQKERELARKNFLLTTGYNFEGYNIIKYLNIVHAEATLGTGFISENLASLSDIFGTSSTAMESKLSKTKSMAEKYLIESALNVGANAVIGVDFDINVLSNNMMLVSVNGTAVKIEKIQK